jgi:hypothetical protein
MLLLRDQSMKRSPRITAPFMPASLAGGIDPSDGVPVVTRFWR